jgi:hypothetical protein
MKQSENSEPVLVFSGTSLQAAILKSLLENAEIEVFLKDEIMGMLNPWWTAPGGAGAVKVFVGGEDAEKAILVVEEYEKNINS